MTQVLAAEGGYQAFTLTSTEWGWLIFAAAVAVSAADKRIVLLAGSELREHSAPGEITVQCLEGVIEFETPGRVQKLQAGLNGITPFMGWRPYAVYDVAWEEKRMASLAAKTGGAASGGH